MAEVAERERIGYRLRRLLRLAFQECFGSASLPVMLRLIQSEFRPFARAWSLRPTAVQRARLYPQGRWGLSSPWSVGSRGCNLTFCAGTVTPFSKRTIKNPPLRSSTTAGHQ